MPNRCFPGTRCRARLTWALKNMTEASEVRYGRNQTYRPARRAVSHGLRAKTPARRHRQAARVGSQWLTGPEHGRLRQSERGGPLRLSNQSAVGARVLGEAGPA